MPSKENFPVFSVSSDIQNLLSNPRTWKILAPERVRKIIVQFGTLVIRVVPTKEMYIVNLFFLLAKIYLT